ncbi:DUF4177 domain-containing protein [Microbacteriaceae bacterium 4G12]
MYEYKFIKIELQKKMLVSEATQDYQEIVNKHAKEGWKLFQIFSPNTYGMGTASYFELIFEREIKGQI